MLAARLLQLGGDRYGGIAIPRVGMEVLVSVLEGDLDQPLVSGCLYHKEHVVPYDLPANKTRTVFKTLSSPGGGGYNEMRIEDRQGAEQIYIHAQRDWDQNIEHDQKIRVGHQRHDTVQANSYTELKADEHLTVHGDRKVEVKPDDHLTVGQSQHIKIGTAQLIKAGSEIHLKAGQKMVIEAGLELTLKAGGSFIKLDPSGITVVGPQVRVNAGGSPGRGADNATLLPMIPLPTDADTAGELLERAVSQPAPEVIHKLRVQISPVPGQPGYPDEPYTLYADGLRIAEGLTGNDGIVVFEHVPGTQFYALELINGHRFEIAADEAATEPNPSLSEQLARQGYRDYQPKAEQLEPLPSAEDYRLAAWSPEASRTVSESKDAT